MYANIIVVAFRFRLELILYHWITRSVSPSLGGK